MDDDHPKIINKTDCELISCTFDDQELIDEFKKQEKVIS